MATSREELKALRAKAGGVVGTHMQKTADMYQEIISYGAKIDAARDAARTANLNALDEQIADLKEDYEDLKEFGNLPTSGGQTGEKQPDNTARTPAGATAKPSSGSEALAALNAAQPGASMNLDPNDGSAYHDTNPGER